MLSTKQCTHTNIFFFLLPLLYVSVFQQFISPSARQFLTSSLNQHNKEITNKSSAQQSNRCLSPISISNSQLQMSFNQIVPERTKHGALIVDQVQSISDLGSLQQFMSTDWQYKSEEPFYLPDNFGDIYLYSKNVVTTIGRFSDIWDPHATKLQCVSWLCSWWDLKFSNPSNGFHLQFPIIFQLLFLHRTEY